VNSEKRTDNGQTEMSDLPDLINHNGRVEQAFLPVHDNGQVRQKCLTYRIL